MKKVEPLFAYFAILAVIQPARIQDIEASAKQLLSPDYADLLIEGGHFRTAHETARERGLIIQVRRGVYFTAPKARHLVRREGLERSIDNRRFFLMKAQRRRYK
ncbi:hypothetical protein [Oceaniradius stylonematis]|uniref:hypothetical protein n=1 Tax=Oceaniradius stylonematis TaxID=2184161 RepID=UPI000D6C33A1|nr:hypothetical protein [Oceaniradius stylonematis]